MYCFVSAFTGSSIMTREPDGTYYAKRSGRHRLNLCLKSDPHYSSSTTKHWVPKALQLIVLPIPVSQPNQLAYCYKHKHAVLILNTNVIYCISLAWIVISESLLESFLSRDVDPIWIISFHANIFANQYLVMFNNGCMTPYCKAHPKLGLRCVCGRLCRRLILKTHQGYQRGDYVALHPLIMCHFQPSSHNLRFAVFCHSYLRSPSFSVS